MMRDPGKIRDIELATTAYGQGVTATPLQLAYATAALANDGVRMKPRLVSRVEDRQGVPEWVQRPEVAGRAVSADTARAVVDMMISVTEDGGTATRARVDGHRVAGKTGTAEKVEDGRYTDARIGSFVGIVPADDPRLVIVITVDEPTVGSRYGGIVAAPAFSAIANESLRVLGVAPTVTDAGAPPAPVVAAATPPVPDAPLQLAWAGAAWTLPDLSGHTLREITTSLAPAGVALSLSGSGRVVSQDPPPGAPLSAGMTVSVLLD
jgi:cell division protein FtsI (penicillin-binding protein 3)